MTDQKRIAVVAVHGVGIHEPHHSASAISRLLLRIPRAFGGRYTSFSESPIGIPTSMVSEAQSESVVAARRSRKLTRKTKRELYDERPERAAESSDEHRDDPTQPDPDVRFMRDQLRDYESDPSAAVYETVRIEGRHIAPDNADGTESSESDARIHLYEMYWSDISRVGRSFLSIFGTFYQVVIHLPYVGLITLEESRKASGGESRLWDSWLQTYRWAMRCMTLVAPTLNILMLAVGIGALTQRIPVKVQPWVALAIPALMVFIGATYLVYHRRTGRWVIDVAFPMMAAVAAFVIGLYVRGPLQSSMVLLIEWWLIACAPLWMIFRAFNRNRPFALPLAATLWIAVGVLLLVMMASRGQHTTSVVVGTLEVLNIGLLLTWFVFALATFWVTVLGWIVPRAGNVNRKDPTLRAAYTARFALALPAVAFAIVTLTIWGALVAAEGGKTFSGEEPYKPLFRYPALEKHKVQDRALAVKAAVADSVTLVARGMPDSAVQVRRHAVARIDGASYFLRAFGGSSDGVWGLIGAVLIGLASIILVWVLVPVLVTEVASPRLDKRERSLPYFSQRAQSLGTWLSTAFRTGRISGEVLVAVTIASMAGIIIAAPIPLPYWMQRVVDPIPAFQFGFTELGGFFLGAGAFGLYALFTRVSIIGSRLRPVFGIMADVDNYLRELPRTSTPRAKMAERYTSLLRYLCRWRADGLPDQGYDAIIIVAHSQGTVITGDLLRYLKHYQAGEGKFEPHLAPLAGDKPAVPIYLVTMGSPLRQIYGQRFPDIYQWVGGACDPQQHPATPYTSKLLGVKAWINLYRSGDYVGRSLWRTPDQLGDIYDPRVPEVNGGERRGEVCIGAGAHTHYWDESAESVALALDAIIRGVVDQTSAAEMIDSVIGAANQPPGVAASR